MSLQKFVGPAYRYSRYQYCGNMLLSARKEMRTLKGDSHDIATIHASGLIGSFSVYIHLRLNVGGGACPPSPTFSFLPLLPLYAFPIHATWIPYRVSASA